MSQKTDAKLKIPEWTEELIDAFETETRQLDTLVTVLRKQREGIAKDQIEFVQDSVSAIHRVLLTLDEARKRRRTLLEMVSSVESARASKEPARVRAARNGLLSAARHLEGELSTSRNVLESALDSTDDEIRTLLGGLEEPAPYAAQPSSSGPGPGRLVDRQI